MCTRRRLCRTRSRSESSSRTPKRRPARSGASSRRRWSLTTWCCSKAILAQARRPSCAGWRKDLGIASDQVSSPTFTLVQEYRAGRLLARPRRSVPVERSAARSTTWAWMKSRPAACWRSNGRRSFASPRTERSACCSNTRGTQSGELPSKVKEKAKGKSKLSEVSTFLLPFAFFLPTSLRSIVRRFLGDRDVVDVAFAHAGGGDAYQLRIPLQRRRWSAAPRYPIPARSPPTSW